MQYLNQLFPKMPAWINIEQFIIVQPNGQVLSQFRILANKNRNNYLKKNNANLSDKQIVQLQRKFQAQRLQQNKALKQKQNKIIKQVIEYSRKLIPQFYKQKLNKLIVDKSLVYFKAKYSVLFILVAKKFSIDIKQIEEIMNSIIELYNQKCDSLNIEMNLVNRKINPFQRRQLGKIQDFIKSQISQKIYKGQSNQGHTPSITVRQQFVKQKLQVSATLLQQREQSLKEIKKYMFYPQQKEKYTNKMTKQRSHIGEEELSSSSDSKAEYSNISELQGIDEIQQQTNFFKRIINKITNKLKRKISEKPMKFKRQISYKQKTVNLQVFMRIRLLLFYVCLILVVTLSLMIYFGWFTQNQDL